MEAFCGKTGRIPVNRGTAEILKAVQIFPSGAAE
jgi:hypothetical protein